MAYWDLLTIWIEGFSWTFSSYTIDSAIHEDVIRPKVGDN